MNTRQAPDASKNRQLASRLHVTVLGASWRANFTKYNNASSSENNSQFLKRFTVSDVSQYK